MSSQTAIDCCCSGDLTTYAFAALRTATQAIEKNAVALGSEATPCRTEQPDCVRTVCTIAEDSSSLQAALICGGQAAGMMPKERRESGQNDLFKARLDQIIDISHPRVRLAHAIDWWFLEEKFGAVYTDGKGSPPLPTRLMAGLHILKYTENLSDERLCEVWAENPYFQYFCGEEFFQHKLVFDCSSLTRRRQRMGEDRLNALIQESLAVA